MTNPCAPAALAALVFLAAPCRGDEPLEKLPYEHPGLVVDLGVGLWAWPVPCDADGDGDYDLVVNCPDKPSNGVWFFENPGTDTAHDKFPVFESPRRLSAGAQNVQASWVAGRLVVMTPGQRHPHFATVGLSAPEKIALPANLHPRKVRANMWRATDLDGDGRTDLAIGVGDWTDYGWDNGYDASGHWTRGPLRGLVYFLRNTATDASPDYAPPVRLSCGAEPLETFGWPSPNFHDFDGDGDLDLLCGEFLDGFTYFQNTGGKNAPSFAPGRRIVDPDGRPVRMALQMITPTAFDWDRDGDADLIVGDEDGRVAFVENTGRRSPEGAPFFLQPVYFKQRADTLKCGALATPVGTDWDGDGDTDIISGNTAGVIEFFENLSGPKVARPRWAAPRRLEIDGQSFRIMAGPNGSIQGPAEAKWGYTTLSVADWDVDGRPDIVLNSILGDVVWLRNEGTRTAPRLSAPQPVEVDWNGPQPALAWGWRRPAGNALLTQWRTTPVVHDFNADGLPDLAMLDHEGYLAFFERVLVDGALRLKAPRRAFTDEKGAPWRLNAKTAGGSGRRKLCVTDWDGDGRFDFLLNSTNADFLRQVGTTADGWVLRHEGSLAQRNIEGHDVSPTTVDFDGDGIPDFLGGAEDGRFYFLRNPRSAR